MASPDELLRRQADLRAEADGVHHDLALDAELAGLGTPVVVGAAALGVMVRRDLDVTTACPSLDAATLRAVAELGARLVRHPRVRSVRIRDDTGAWNTDPAYPDGLYLGVAILAVKHARPGVRGVDVYRAVLDGGVRTPDDFDRWRGTTA